MTATTPDFIRNTNITGVYPYNKTLNIALESALANGSVIQGAENIAKGSSFINAIKEFLQKKPEQVSFAAKVESPSSVPGENLGNLTAPETPGKWAQGVRAANAQKDTAITR